MPNGVVSQFKAAKNARHIGSVAGQASHLKLIIVSHPRVEPAQVDLSLIKPKLKLYVEDAAKLRKANAKLKLANLS